MERTLLWSAFVIGCLGWICACLFARSRRTSAEVMTLTLPRAYAVMAVLIPLVVFVGTLPSRAPFAPGQGLGRGFLLGALGAWLSGLGLRLAFGRSDYAGGDERSAAAAPSGPLFLGLAAAAVPLLWMRTVLPDALLGVAVGWFVVSFLLLCAWIGQGQSGQLAALAQSSGVGFVVTLVALAALGGLRDAVRFTSAPMPVAWSAVGLAFASCIPLLVLLGALLAAPLAHAGARIPGSGLLARLTERFVRGDNRRWIALSIARLLPTALICLLVARMFRMRLEGRPPLIWLTEAGLAAGLICWWLASETTAERTSGMPPAAWQSRGLAALTMLSAVMVAYQLFAGFGVTWMLLGAWLVVGCVLSSLCTAHPASERVNLGPASRLMTALLFGVVITLYRLFATQFRHELQGVEITDHYALFGILIGAMVPSLLTGFLVARSGGKPHDVIASPAGIVAVGALTLFVPTVILILFGAKCALAIFFGLAIAALSSAPPTEPTDGHSACAALSLQLLPGLFAVAIALALTQWTHHVLPLALYARAAKVRALGALVGGLIVVILAADYGDRLRFRPGARRHGDEPSGSKGAVK